MLSEGPQLKQYPQSGRRYPSMAMAAKAFGANGFFFEVHPDPDKGMSDAANMLELEKLEAVVEQLIK